MIEWRAAAAMRAAEEEAAEGAGRWAGVVSSAQGVVAEAVAAQRAEQAVRRPV